jgi:hypothetical protein
MCTPATIQQHIDLICRYCASEEALKTLHKTIPSQYERSIVHVFEALGWDALWRPEVRHERWNGAIDFYFPCYRLLVQVDGEQHFQKRMHGVPLGQQRHADLRMNAWA